MRFISTVCMVLAATSAQAHPGHLADVAGHDHWVAGAAVGIAILIGLWGALKGGKDKDTEASESDAPDLEEAAA